MSPQSRLEGPIHGVKLRQEDTSVFVDGKRLGSGALLIAESCVYWRSPSGERLSLDYTSISLHAVSRDLTTFPHEHLYMLMNGKLPGEDSARAEAGGGDSDNDEEVEEDLEAVTELRFVPPDAAALDGMFAALCECQALHPDPDDASSEDIDSEDDDDDDDDDDDEEGGECVDGAGDTGQLPDDVAVASLTAAGRAVLARLEGMLSDVPNFGDMAGVQSQSGQEADNDAMDVDAAHGENGQFDDADLDK
uniref:methylosome subunit pICln-like isoform X1 n=1 Tax=Myxine glutinosa TaxID=7769 RepID=UPI00358F7704